MSQSGKNWMPSMHMPITGLVRPQPSSNYVNRQPQTMFNQNTSAYPMPNLHHQIGNIQQGELKSREFLQMNGNCLIQQQLIEDQRRLSQHAGKQRHFNEQKEKFCAFNPKSTSQSPNTSRPNYQNSANVTEQNIPQPPPTTNSSNKKQSRLPLPLPMWLADSFQLPAVYKKAGGLVEAQNGFVDTSRAYMLLMRTGIPPPLLGVMWEMVNRTQPGQLKVEEFYGLLALVALVQNGHTVPSADYLASIEQPICPFIDHPVLAMYSDKSAANKEKEVPVIVTKESNDFEEFDDFVSAPSVNVPPNTPTPITDSVSSPVCLANTTEIKSITIDPSSINNKEICPPKDTIIPSTDSANDIFLNNNLTDAPIVIPRRTCGSASTTDVTLLNKNIPTAPTKVTINPLNYIQSRKQKLSPPPQVIFNGENKTRSDKINLPIVGASPKRTMVEEDFADFQSNVSKFNEVTSRPTNQSILLPVDDKTADRYAVLRGIGAVAPRESKGKSSAPDSHCDTDFGDFQAAQKESTGLPMDTQLPLFEADLQRTYSLDPFGEFDDGAKLDLPMSLNMQVSCTNPKLMNEEDDEFGDFVSSDFTAKNSFETNSLTVADVVAETQSVTSLELPDLDATINLSCSNLFPLNVEPVSREPSRLNSLEEGSTAQDSIKASSLDFEDIFASNVPQIPAATNQDFNPSTVPDSVPVADKYSIIRDDLEENEYVDTRSETWQRCLTGCNKLLQEGATIMEQIPVENEILREVLATSQMCQYLSNLNEVWRVCQRMIISTRKLKICSKIEDLLADNQALWTSIVSISECQFDKINDKDGQLEENEICNVCLCQGNANLSYGRHHYHATCANLWLNAVHAILPAGVP